MAQMKEQNKTTEKNLNKMEIANLSDKEFKTGQEGGVGRYTLLLHTTKKGTMNLETKNNQNFQKLNCIED